MNKMRLAAIYIEEHDYLFSEPQTINFGAKYLYTFIKKGKNIIVRRTLNENFIPGFFDLTRLDSKVSNVNAIVGQNGAGKTTVLDIIRSEFIEHKYALPQSECLFLFEVDENDDPVVLRNDFDKIYLEKEFRKRNIRKELHARTRKIAKPQTIYYSPHYDYKYNPNFDNADDHDISFDKIVEKDLESLNEKDTNENGWPYSPSQELMFKNSLRQIQFLSSDLVRKHNVFKDIFDLQGHYEPILHFRGYLEKEKDWNTPYQLREILKSISDKVEKEHKDWHIYRDSGVSQEKVHQYILKRNVIRGVLSLLYKQMERKNSFLQEGYFPYDRLKGALKRADAYKTLIFFIKHSAIKLRAGKPVKIFSTNSLENLLAKTYEAIEKANEKDSVTNGTLRVSVDDATLILKLQREFLNELSNYYTKFYKNEKDTIADRERIDEFINYMPFSRRMSSGESALLNLFSRIYDFLNSNLKELKFLKPNQHYILLLDEADLTFHITWKKKYVKAILKTLPYFFNELENKPSFEIIFTTHDPITLSDLPNANVIYIERPNYESLSNILKHGNKRRPLKTFGANISDLIADSFFIEDSLIGDFAFEKIQTTITWLTEKENLEDVEYHKKLISLIDEPIVQRKLAEMFDDKTQQSFQLDIINDQIQKLENLKSKLIK